MASKSSNTPRTPRTAAKRHADVAEPPAPPVTVYGIPGQQIDVLPVSSLNLLMSMGRVKNGGEVLVPYVELRIKRELSDSREIDPSDAFMATITYENAAFLMMDLAGDFATLSTQLAQIAQGEVLMEQVRMAYSKDCLERAREHLTTCLKALDRVPSQRPA